jgi:hypothetical protein
LGVGPTNPPCENVIICYETSRRPRYTTDYTAEEEYISHTHTHTHTHTYAKKKMRWAGHVAHMAEERKMNKVLAGKAEENIPLGRLTHRWEDGI